MRLYIKNMVCHRCKLAVENELKKVGLTPVQVELGEAMVNEDSLTSQQEKELSRNLQAIGFELLDDKRKKLIEKIKTLIVESIHYDKNPGNKNFSKLISEHLHHDYSYLSKLFSETEGITIEQFIISQKIEKAKELLVYDEMSLSQIAFELNYSSVAHLSAQFKKITGLTPSAFKKSGIHHRHTLDSISG
jgi:AraC-like DNA-binding protein